MNTVTSTLCSLQQELTTCYLSNVTKMFVSKTGPQRGKNMVYKATGALLQGLYFLYIINLNVAGQPCQIMKR